MTLVTIDISTNNAIGTPLVRLVREQVSCYLWYDSESFRQHHAWDMTLPLMQLDYEYDRDYDYGYNFNCKCGY